MLAMCHLLLGVVSISGALAASCPALEVKSTGEPTGQLRSVSGIEMYHAFPQPSNDNATSSTNTSTTTKAIIHLTDIFGIPLVENKLLADSLAAASGILVVTPDLFSGDAISVSEQEAGLNLTEWFTRHPPEAIERVIDATVRYVRAELGVSRVGAVGYCFGGRYVARSLATTAGTNEDGEGVDVGFVAHPSGLLEGEIAAVERPLSIAAGTLDASFNATARRRAEEILDGRNATFQSSVYSQAPHGFAVRPNVTVPQQVFAKQGAFVQAVTWLDAWL